MDTPTQRIRPHDGASILHAQVELSDVNAIRFRKECDIRAIVHDEAHNTCSRRGRAGEPGGDGPGNVEKFPAGSALITILEKLNPGFRHHFGERQLRRLEQSGIDYGIERREDKTHLGGCYLACTGSRCSRKCVSRRPASKSGIRQNALVQRQRSLDALDNKHLQGAAHPGNGLGTVAAVND